MSVPGRLDPVLDGTAEIDPAALAALAYERVQLAAGWLGRAVRPSGRFRYVYQPVEDRWLTGKYSPVRHAGATWSMYQAAGALRDDPIRDAAERALGFIAQRCQQAEPGGRAFVFGGRAKLGAQALALVALLERRQAYQETSFDGLIGVLAEFLLAMEVEAEPGRYYQFWDAGQGERLLEPASVYYPGEALLALTRLAQQFPHRPYLDAARRAAHYLIYRRDGPLPELRKVLLEDHWLVIALGELYRLVPKDEYAMVAYLHVKSMLSRQYSREHGVPELIGAARRSGPPSYTSTATKGEALLAGWALAAFRGDTSLAARIAAGAQREVQFQLRVQFTRENTEPYPRPDRLVGAWGQSQADPSVRIDYVQHNLSALLGAWYLLTDGDLPVAGLLAEDARTARRAL